MTILMPPWDDQRNPRKRLHPERLPLVRDGLKMAFSFWKRGQLIRACMMVWWFEKRESKMRNRIITLRQDMDMLQSTISKSEGIRSDFGEDIVIQWNGKRVSTEELYLRINEGASYKIVIIPGKLINFVP